MPIEVAKFMAGLGLKVFDVYGMTETCGAVTANGPAGFRLGTVGRATPGMEVTLGEDNEVLVRGPVITPGYHQQEQATRNLIDADGWVHTGDIGSLDEDGFFAIVDRKKELIITSAGKNIAPSNIENYLKESPLVGHAMAIGDNRAYIVAILTLDGEIAPLVAAQLGIETTDLAELSQHPQVRAMVRDAVDKANARLSRPEQVKSWELLPHEWTAESEELTPDPQAQAPRRQQEVRRRGERPLRLVTFDLQAHRGGAGPHPENTLAAFGAALTLGVSTLELDVHLTRDDDVVVSHDPALADARLIRHLGRADLPPSMPLLRDVAALLGGARGGRRTHQSRDQVRRARGLGAHVAGRVRGGHPRRDPHRRTRGADVRPVLRLGCHAPGRQGGAGRTPQPARLPEVPQARGGRTVALVLTARTWRRSSSSPRRSRGSTPSPPSTAARSCPASTMRHTSPSPTASSSIAHTRSACRSSRTSSTTRPRWPRSSGSASTG
ncbi:AMP-binding protein [Nocardioides sp. B-3]|nr:glycerophosphodiester phosphodiesterase family protein [Nocardioides sp. B-3]UUZ57949.1 AMP-binding protein [Nocardioides sp. B-3]